MVLQAWPVPKPSVSMFNEVPSNSNESLRPQLGDPARVLAPEIAVPDQSLELEGNKHPGNTPASGSKSPMKFPGSSEMGVDAIPLHAERVRGTVATHSEIGNNLQVRPGTGSIKLAILTGPSTGSIRPAIPIGPSTGNNATSIPRCATRVTRPPRRPTPHTPSKTTEVSGLPFPLAPAQATSDLPFPLAPAPETSGLPFPLAQSYVTKPGLIQAGTRGYLPRSDDKLPRHRRNHLMHRNIADRPAPRPFHISQSLAQLHPLHPSLSQMIAEFGI